jgi:hypothetical protein
MPLITQKNGRSIFFLTPSSPVFSLPANVLQIGEVQVKFDKVKQYYFFFGSFKKQFS